MKRTAGSNIDASTVAGFGQEWAAFDQSGLSDDDFRILFDRYFDIFPFDRLPADAEGFDLGCGSGRWALEVSRRVGSLHCIDPSPLALDVARRRLKGRKNVDFHNAGVDSIPLPDGSQDFGYSLGVLHHVPDTRRGLQDCVRKLKPGAPFLLYLYYAMDGRPAWFRAVWQASNFGRRFISRLPFGLRKGAAELIAAGVYWPLARAARLGEKAGANVFNWPLSSYRQVSFYSMRTDALDRFGTKLEQRFTRSQIDGMMRDAGLRDIRFSEREPFWVACGVRAR